MKLKVLSSSLLMVLALLLVVSVGVVTAQDDQPITDEEKEALIPLEVEVGRAAQAAQATLAGVSRIVCKRNHPLGTLTPNIGSSVTIFG